MREFKRTSTKPLGELLIERGVLSRQQLDEALAYQQKNGGRIGTTLVLLKFATEQDIAQALTCQYGFPYLPLTNYEVDLEVLRSVPEDVCRKFQLIPVDKIGKSLTIAIANPLNVKDIEDVELITGCVIQIFVSTATDIRETIDRYYPTKKQ